MESILRDEVEVEHLTKSKEYARSFFHTMDTVHTLFRFCFSSTVMCSFILQQQNCDEVSTFYISKVASEIAGKLPDEIKDMVLADEALMEEILTLVDDEHFSPQYAIGYATHLAMRSAFPTYSRAFRRCRRLRASTISAATATFSWSSISTSVR